MRVLVVAVPALLVMACSTSETAQRRDAGRFDSGATAADTGSGEDDAGSELPDTGASSPDLGAAPDAGSDSGPRDGGILPSDTGPRDTGPVGDTGPRDSGGPFCVAPALTVCGGQCVDIQNDPAHCTGCNRRCTRDNAVAGCMNGGCTVVSCSPGFGNCNNNPDDGCERQCVSGTACTTSCMTAGTTLCGANACAPTCTPPAETCNVVDDNCNGQCDEGTACRQPVHRVIVAGREHFYTISRPEAAAHQVENYDYFFTYSGAQTGLVSLNRCVLSNGYHFYTTAPNCEGAVGSIEEGSLGFCATSPTCGSTPLYRLVGGPDHLYTISAGERDALVNSGGWVSEGIQCHVWTGM